METRIEGWEMLELGRYKICLSLGQPMKEGAILNWEMCDVK